MPPLNRGGGTPAGVGPLHGGTPAPPGTPSFGIRAQQPMDGAGAPATWEAPAGFVDSLDLGTVPPDVSMEPSPEPEYAVEHYPVAYPP